MKNKLEVCDVTHAYHSSEGETAALKNISFSVKSGEFLVIIGPSGCGKSTLLSILSGMLKAEQGKVLIDGIPLDESSAKIGYMLQQDYLFEWRTIERNASLGLEIRHEYDEAAREKLLAMLESYGLSGFEHVYPHELSGGMRQRAALIRTLALNPDLLLLDEPFSALDYQTRLSVSDDISSIIRQTKKTAILITHDLSEAISIADRILVLSARPGRIQTIVTLDFSDACTRPIERRNSKEFPKYFNLLWRELQQSDYA